MTSTRSDRMTFTQRMLGAVQLDALVYEDVEADRGATGQAALLIVAASAAGAVGAAGYVGTAPRALAGAAAGSLIGWLAWATLTTVIGTRFLPEAQTRADVGQLLRVLGFAATPGLLRIFGGIPFVGPVIYVFASVWMLAATIVGVRQALDYQGSGRAIAVCVLGWALSLVIAAIIGILFASPVS